MSITTLKSRESIMESLSDLHKEARGYRSREDYSQFTLEELNDFYEELLEEAEESVEQERKLAEESLSIWNARMQKYMIVFNIDLKTAIRWEMQAEEDYGFYSHDIGYYLFNNGISELDAHEIKQKIAA